MNDQKNLQIGDVVRLKSDGDKWMTVIEKKVPHVKCVALDDNCNIQSYTHAIATLVKACYTKTGDIKKGDEVHLNSTWHSLMVREDSLLINKGRMRVRAVHGEMADCVWYNSQEQLQQESFPVAALDKLTFS